MVRMTVLAKVSPEKREEFLQAMRALQAEKMKRKGLSGSRVSEDHVRGGFRLQDEWEREEDLTRYREGESFGVFLGALKTLCVEAEVEYGSPPAK